MSTPRRVSGAAMRRFALGAIAVAAPATSGCSPPWVVVRQTPDALAGIGALALSPIEFADAEVDGAPLASLDASAPAQRETAQLLREVDSIFAAMLASDCAQDGIRIARDGSGEARVVVPRVIELRRGTYAHDAQTPSRLVLAVTITTADGAPLDDILVEHETRGVPQNPTATGRLRDDAREVAAIVAEYVRRRAGEARP